MTVQNTVLPHTIEFVLFLSLVALIKDANGRSMRKDQLFVPKILCKIENVTCSRGDGQFVYTNGCQFCSCSSRGNKNEGTCRGPTCRPEKAEDKQVCDKVRQETREIAKRRLGCRTPERICPNSPSATFQMHTFQGCASCKCNGKDPSLVKCKGLGARDLNIEKRGRCAKMIVYYIHLTEKAFEQLCA